MPKLVFQHGWGFDEVFFEKLAEKLKGFETIILDTGYFCNKKIHVFNSADCVGIGHSLGFAKLIEQQTNWKGVISIGGFAQFIYSKRSQIALTKMIDAFKQKPLSVLKSFYKKCDACFYSKKIISKEINQELLLHDLVGLATKNITTKLKNCNYKILGLHATNDQIISYQDTQRYFSDKIKLHNFGNHALGLNEIDWCANQIKVFINDLAEK